MRIFLFIALFLFLLASNTSAIENPQETSNNKFGIHIIDENDLSTARDLVNSGGGDWGYIVLVIREDERVISRWQEVFNQMRRFRLIPIVRIASIQTPEGWAKPKIEDLGEWVSFLNSLNWVVKNRYVVIGNEPNQAHEWGGKISPDEYASYLKEFSKRLKNASNDFFVLPAGFDAAAPNSKTTMSEEKFLIEITRRHPDFFGHLDGWTSHSYPNPDLPINNQSGRGSLRTYLWELALLKRLGVQNQLPVFITETGWRHNGNEEQADISQNYINAFEKVWQDERLVVVAPFLLNYKGKPFLEFSWLDPAGKPYKFYHEVQKIPKIAGNPTQITDGAILGRLTLPIVQSTHGLYGLLIVENKGQSIWQYPDVDLNEGEVFPYANIEPYQRRILFFKVQAPDRSGLNLLRLQLQRKNISFGNISDVYVRTFEFVSPFQLFRLILPAYNR